MANNEDRHWCTGTRVSYNAIITAMHCACDYFDETKKSDPFLQSWRFREGTDVVLEDNTDLEYEGTRLMVTDFELRSTCVAGTNNYTDEDLMPIRTYPPIGLLNGYSPYRVRTLYNFGAVPDPIDREVLVVGYGRSDASTQLSSGQRLQGTMRVDTMHDDDGSINRSFDFAPLTPVSEGGAHTCAGDSGAPVFYGDVNGESAIYGIYSAGDFGCGSVGGKSAAWGRATIIDDDHRDWYWEIVSGRWLADPILGPELR